MRADSLNRAGVAALIVLLAIWGTWTISTGDDAPVTDQRDSAAQPFELQVDTFANRYCVECHAGDEPAGKLSLDRLPFDVDDPQSRQIWQLIADRVTRGEMPPEGSRQPEMAEVNSLMNELTSRITAAETADRAANGRVVLRRLNRVEFENTINDLFGLRLNLRDQLPQDGSAAGFDNVGEALHTSVFLMEQYLAAIDIALDEAIANLPQPRRIDERMYCWDQHHVKISTERVFRRLEDSLVLFSSSEWNQIHMYDFYPSERGRYRFRISANGYQSQGSPVTYRVIVGNTQLSGRNGLVGYFDAPADEPIVVEFEQDMEPHKTIAILPYGLARAQAVDAVGAENWEGPGLEVQWVDVEGPLYDAWPPESHRLIFCDLPQAPAPIYNHSDRVEVVSEQPLADAEEIFLRFSRRAFRRTVTAAEVQPYVAIVEERMANGYSFEQSVRAALKGVLVSPEFLFLREAPGRLDDFALASRLSYFLWSTMPDEELLILAEEDRLDDADVLRAQVERMLGHPKAAAFTENFLGQWLGLREIDFTEPSHILYPEFDHMLKVSMLRETELFFEELLQHDLSIANFVDSDFTMLNGRLARHYGLEGPEGWEFVRYPLPADSHRGGVLTMASVLKITANGTTTSPVLRGAWVLDRILGTRPPPPPADVGVIDPDIRGTTTIREQLDAHRAVASCARCHTQIDPPGFALESFDCIGGWREHYRSTGNGEPVVIDGVRMHYLQGQPVDCSGVMADGETFSNIDEFKQLLLRDIDQIARALTIKLVTYATGGAPTRLNDAEIDAIVAELRGNNNGLRSLVHAVVQSEMFRNK